MRRAPSESRRRLWGCRSSARPRAETRRRPSAGDPAGARPPDVQAQPLRPVVDAAVERRRRRRAVERAVRHRRHAPADERVRPGDVVHRRERIGRGRRPRHAERRQEMRADVGAPRRVGDRGDGLPGGDEHEVRVAPRRPKRGDGVEEADAAQHLGRRQIRAVPEQVAAPRLVAGAVAEEIAEGQFARRPRVFERETGQHIGGAGVPRERAAVDERGEGRGGDGLGVGGDGEDGVGIDRLRTPDLAHAEPAFVDDPVALDDDDGRARHLPVAHRRRDVRVEAVEFGGACARAGGAAAAKTKQAAIRRRSGRIGIGRLRNGRRAVAGAPGATGSCGGRRGGSPTRPPPKFERAPLPTDVRTHPPPPTRTRRPDRQNNRPDPPSPPIPRPRHDTVGEGPDEGGDDGLNAHLEQKRTERRRRRRIGHDGADGAGDEHRRDRGQKRDEHAALKGAHSGRRTGRKHQRSRRNGAISGTRRRRSGRRAAPRREAHRGGRGGRRGRGARAPSP